MRPKTTQLNDAEKKNSTCTFVEYKLKSPVKIFGAMNPAIALTENRAPCVAPCSSSSTLFAFKAAMAGKIKNVAFDRDPAMMNTINRDVSNENEPCWNKDNTRPFKKSFKTAHVKLKANKPRVPRQRNNGCTKSNCVTAEEAKTTVKKFDTSSIPKPNPAFKPYMNKVSTPAPTAA